MDAPTHRFPRRYLGRGHGRQLRHGGDLQGLQGGAGRRHLRAGRLELGQQMGRRLEGAHGLAGQHLLQGRWLRQGLLLRKKGINTGYSLYVIKNGSLDTATHSSL